MILGIFIVWFIGFLVSMCLYAYYNPVSYLSVFDRLVMFTFWFVMWIPILYMYLQEKGEADRKFAEQKKKASELIK